VVDQVEDAGYREYRRMKRNANAHIASGSFLFVVGILITWGVYSATGGGMIVVALGLVFGGIAEFILGLRMRSEL
jgi:O-antigen/teichoic acid export membrane protein